MNQEVTFELLPTANHNEAVGHARYVVNASTGIGMDILEQVIREHIPAVDHPQVITVKKIIRTDRFECPGCNTNLTALVQVYCRGLITDDWIRVSGLYRIGIHPDHGHSKVIVERLSSRTIHQGNRPYLPSKDYNINPKANKEIDDRDAAISKMVQENPGQGVGAGGFETDEDLDNLGQAIIEKIV